MKLRMILALSAMCALAALAPSAASASGSKLVLRNGEGGEVLTAGTQVDMFANVGPGGCIILSATKLTKNSAAKDKTEAGNSTEDWGCRLAEEGYAVAGEIGAASVSGSTASYKTSLEVTLPGECVYSVKKLTAAGPPTLPGYVSTYTTGTGKLDKAASAKVGCAKTQTIGAEVEWLVGEFEGEVWGEVTA